MFDQICTKIISPPKFRYSLYDLGPTLSKLGKRTDFHIHNHKHIKMNCSLYEPHQITFQRSCVVYLHSMNGSRLEGSVYVERILKQGVSFCTFDFSGCGNSQGNKISFGANQKHDIQALINKLKETFYLNRFILWGRSMGSVSAIKYSQLVYDKSKTIVSYQNQEIVGLVLDSSFKSFSQLLVEIGHTQSEIPKFLIQAGFFIIKNTLERLGEFKLTDLDLISQSGSNSGSQKYPLQKLQNLKLPILFLASKQDKTVSYEHSVDMFQAYKCRSKDLKYFKGLHNESREQDYMIEVIEFIRKMFKRQVENRQEISIDEKIGSFNSIQSVSQLGEVSKNAHNQRSSVKPRTSLMKLIEEHSSNEETSTLFEFETVQNTCVCTMFDNELVRHQSQSFRQKQKSTHFKESKPIPSGQKINLPSEQSFQRSSVSQSKPKKSISEISTASQIKHAEYYGPNLSKPVSSQHFAESLSSPRSFKRIGETMELKWRKMEESDYTGLNKEEPKIFEELYSPLKVASEKSLRLKDSLKVE